MKPQYVDEYLKACVDKASVTLTPQLQLQDSNIQGVWFQHGHPKEIINYLGELSQGTTSKTKRYPLVALFRDFPEDKGRANGIYSEATLNIIIATRTDPDYHADKRKEVSFKPILYPILNELFNQIENSGKFIWPGKDMLQYTQVDHYFWGREEIYGVSANIFNDWIDCIELKNFKLSTYLNNC